MEWTIEQAKALQDAFDGAELVVAAPDAERQRLLWQDDRREVEVRRTRKAKYLIVRRFR
jgi:hypothetical protein